MTRRRRKSDSSDPRQKAKDLIEVALDESTTLEERRTAAVRAVKFIDKYDLLARPFDGNETVQAALNAVDTLTRSDLVDDLKKIASSVAAVSRRRR